MRVTRASDTLFRESVSSQQEFADEYPDFYDQADNYSPLEIEVYGVNRDGVTGWHGVVSVHSDGHIRTYDRRSGLSSSVNMNPHAPVSVRWREHRGPFSHLRQDWDPDSYSSYMPKGYSLHKLRSRMWWAPEHDSEHSYSEWPRHNETGEFLIPRVSAASSVKQLEDRNTEQWWSNARDRVLDKQTLSDFPRLRSGSGRPLTRDQLQARRHELATESDFAGNDSGNCTRTTLAYTARVLWGLDAKAIPWGYRNPDQYSSGRIDLEHRPGHPSGDYWEEGPLASLTLPDGSPHGRRMVQNDKTREQVEQEVSSWPHGAMGWASYSHPTGGHILPVHNIHGQAHFYEPQGGVGRIPQAERDEYFKGSHSWSLARVDDLRPTDDTAKMMALPGEPFQNLPHPYSPRWQSYVWQEHP